MAPWRNAGDGRGQPALCRHLAVARGAPGPPPLREALLRARRDGEPHQGMPARPLCRPHLGPDDARNQLRLWLASMAYVLLCALRRIGLKHTQFAQATCGTIRLKLLKLGALVRISVRRIKLAMPSACPFQHEFSLAHARLRNTAA